MMVRQSSPQAEYAKGECGCRAIHGTKGYYIGYCPKHKTAPDLYEALKWVSKMASHSNADSQIILMAIKALSKAEGGG